MTQETKQLPLPALTLPAKTSDLSGLQKGWLAFAQLRNETFEKLTRYELDVQLKTKHILESDNLEEARTNLKAVKAIAAECKELRLLFTNTIKERIIDRAMEFEKRNDALITTAEAHELELRKKAEAETNKTRDLVDEKARFKAHIENEFRRIATKYRTDMGKLINESYVQALTVNMAVELMPDYIAKVKTFVADVKLDKPVKFERRFMNDEEAKTEYATIRRYESADDLRDALKLVDDTFATYAGDLQNKEQAIKAAEAERLERERVEQENLQQDTQINTLVAGSAQFTVANTPAVKRKWRIEDENSSTWAMMVLSAFMANFKDLQKYIGVKNWAKLSIGQMAIALADLRADNPDKKFANFKWVELEK